MTVELAFPTFSDERGDLVALEFTALPFVPERAFTVTSATGDVIRGGHVAGCRQILVVSRGRVVVTVHDGSGVRRTTELSRPGAAVEIAGDEHVEYELVDAFTSVLVLADRPYAERPAMDGVRSP